MHNSDYFGPRVPKPVAGTHYGPLDLAEFAWRRWPQLIGGSYSAPKRPSRRAFQLLVEAAYQASLEIEEGRLARFALTYSSGPTLPVRQGRGAAIPALLFDPRRAFALDELRRLSVATNPDSTSILIADTRRKGLQIAGLLHVGPSWSAAMRGYQPDFQPPPFALNLYAHGPGLIDLYQGVYRIARLTSGRLLPSDTQGIFDQVRLGDHAREGLDKLSKLIRSPEHEHPREWNSYEFDTYANVVFGLINALRSMGHGGTIVLVQDVALGCIDSIFRVKYQLTGDAQPLRAAFVQFLNARHRWGDAMELDESGKHKLSPDESKLINAQVGDSARELSQVISLVSRLGGTDGALILASDLRLIGFGAEITAPAATTAVYEAVDPLLHERRRLDPEQFGMRHRSAVRLVCSGPGLLAYVVSQDGSVSIMFREEDATFVRKGFDPISMSHPLS